MSYPQPNPDRYAANSGSQFFRLNTQLISDGDIYESPQGAQGFAVGPDSDIAKVNIGYYDDQIAGFLNQVAISPGRPFPGVVFARNDSVYVPSNRPGRILIWPDEIYNPTYTPQFLDVTGRVDFEVPVLDVVQYFAPGGLAMTGGRNDKEYAYDFIPVTTAGVDKVWALIIPWYGRRFANMNWYNGHAGNLSYEIAGLHYKPGAAQAAAVITPIQAATVVAGFANAQRPILGDVVGTFDALQFLFYGAGITNTEQSPLRITTSDRQG